MASNKKVPGSIKTMIIGGFTVFGILVVVWAIFFFKPSPGDNKNKMTINFANIEGIDVGTRVTYAGRPVGEVTEIEYIPRNTKKVLDSAGNPYSFAVTVKLDSKINVYTTDLIEIRTSGLLGEKSIAIIPQQPQPGVQEKSVLGGTIYATSEDPLSTTLKTVQNASEEIARTMSTVTEMLNQNSSLIHESIKNLNVTVQGVTKIVNQAEYLNLLGNINDAFISIGRFSNNANTLVNQAQQMRLLQKIDVTFENLADITENVANGKGTLGKLVYDPTLYLEALSVMDRVNQLVYDLNHYGLLFHRNRQWKEEQQKRIEEMANLKTPEAFTQAFERDMAQINQALNRVSQMVDQAEMGQEEVLDSNEFKKYFFDLLQQVNHLQNLIELYNQKMTGP